MDEAGSDVTFRSCRSRSRLTASHESSLLPGHHSAV